MVTATSSLYAAWQGERAGKDSSGAVNAAHESLQVSAQQVDGELQRLVAEAAAAWPQLKVSPEALVGHLARVMPANTQPAQYLAIANGPDLLLAYSCAHSNLRAIHAFDARHDADLRMVYAQARGQKPPFDEYAQSVRTKILTGAAPRLLAYAGIGELKNWLRVTASRVLVDLQRGAPTGQHLGQEAAMSIPTPDDDPEAAYLKRLYRSQMRDAFEAAVQQLTPAERNCLRDYYAQALTIDQIANAHGIHRATAARRVANARSAVLRHTRQLLMSRTQLSQDELASVVRLIESQLYVSVERVFAGHG